MRQCVRCGNPMCAVSASEFECPTCGLIQITSYERNDDVPLSVVAPADEHAAYLGCGGIMLHEE